MKKLTLTLSILSILQFSPVKAFAQREKNFVPIVLIGGAIIGKIIYEIIVANRPVIEESTKPIHLLPLTDLKKISPYDLENWQGPIKKSKSHALPQLLEPLNYTLAFEYGGSYQGKGQYLAGIHLSHLNIIAPTGVKIGLQMKLLDRYVVVKNGEETATAVIQVRAFDVKYTHITYIKDTFKISGSGEITEL